MNWKKLARITYDKAAEGAGGAGDIAPDGALAAAAAAEAAKAAADGKGGDGKGGTEFKVEPAADDATYWPQGLPDTFKGNTRKEILDKIAADFAGRPKAPEKPDGYALNLGDEISSRYGDLSKDPVLAMWRETAHELGMTDAQFNGVIGKLHQRMAKAGMVFDPAKVDEQLMSLGGDAGTPVERKAAGAKRLQAAVGSVKALVTSGELSVEDAREAVKMAQNANGVVALEKLIKRGQKPGVVAGGEPGGGGAKDTGEATLKRFFPTMHQ